MKWTLLLTLAATLSAQASPFPALYGERGIFERAIDAERDHPVPDGLVTGITVPHHLLAPNLIARGFHAASRSDYRRIVVLFPDHFEKAPAPFATTSRSFHTILGTLECDTESVATLLDRCGRLLKRSDLFATDHGIQALTPFIAHHFPNARLVPLALRIDSQPAHWQVLADALEPLIDDRTLIVQSTDFSHYLPQPPARRRDQETLNLLAANDIPSIAKLLQPAHLDSKAAQWIHSTLQHNIHGTRPLCIANANSQDYSPWTVRETTSYIVQIFQKNSAPWPPYQGDRVYFFAGDTFFGRNVPSILDSLDPVLKITDGHPMILNLEGVTLPNVPDKFKNWPLVMPEDLTIDTLKKLNVIAVSLANNHTLDLGQAPFERMRQRLESAGIQSVAHGEKLDLGPFQLAAFTDIRNQPVTTHRIIREKDLTNLEKSENPLFAFLHWGHEYQKEPGAREKELTRFLIDREVSALVGAHPHTTGKTRIEALKGGAHARVFSLGNFLFDQTDRRSNGALLEVRFFSQGTYFLRWHPIGNLYRKAQSPSTDSK